MHPTQPSLTSLRLLLLLAVVCGFFFNLNGVPRFDKPALIHWLQAASVTAFGWNEFALRLPSALAAAAWVLVVYGFARVLGEERVGLIAAIAMATSLEIPIIAKAATADAVLNLFITGAMLAAFLHYRRSGVRYLYLCFFVMGLGFLTKGPV